MQIVGLNQLKHEPRHLKSEQQGDYSDVWEITSFPFFLVWKCILKIKSSKTLFKNRQGDLDDAQEFTAV